NGPTYDVSRDICPCGGRTTERFSFGGLTIGVERRCVVLAATVSLRMARLTRNFVAWNIRLGYPASLF
ncbi:hypothetical protein, partial [Escherichia coli]|uniref:hypothetical protein n=1 Tax=Escherichia coli TaxID=562 RepID=UPI001953C9BB